MPPPGARHDRLDALRGAAMLWMAGFHFSFDLNLYGLLAPRQDFYRDPFWTGQRICIVSLFLFCAGLGQAVAQAQGQPWPRFWRRWAQVAGCAALVSLGSAQMFPRSWISFGVLHGIAVMLLVCRLAAPSRAAPWLLGLAALALWLGVQDPFFDTRATNWVGLVTHKPVTEDWVPVLPWLAAMAWGLAAGQTLLRHRAQVMTAPLPARLRPLARLGRWPLSFYMLHQPLLIGALLGGRNLGWW
jgi:uncharacterized membrane protein